MTGTDVFLLIVRWLHLTAAAAWIGGSIFYLLVLRPAVRRVPETPPALSRTAALEFRSLVWVCIVVLIATGVILAFNRLTLGIVGTPYAATLGIKVILTVWMFLLARSQRRRYTALDPYRQAQSRPPGMIGKISDALSGYNVLLILGIVVFLLSDLLKVLFELALAGR